MRILDLQPLLRTACELKYLLARNINQRGAQSDYHQDKGKTYPITREVTFPEFSAVAAGWMQLLTQPPPGDSGSVLQKSYTTKLYEINNFLASKWGKTDRGSATIPILVAADIQRAGCARSGCIFTTLGCSIAVGNAIRLGTMCWIKPALQRFSSTFKRHYSLIQISILTKPLEKYIVSNHPE